MSNETAVVPAQEAVDPYIQRMKQLGAVLAGSKLFPGTTGVLQAMVKAMFGEALGLTPAESQWGLHTVPGKPPSLSATLVAARIKARGRYNYRVRELTDTACTIAFFECVDGRWEEVGTASFTIEDAKRADLTKKEVWKVYPKSMLFSRALTAGARIYTPDVFFGNGIYTPEELGVEPAGRQDIERVETQLLPEIIDPEFTVSDESEQGAPEDEDIY